MLLDTAACRQGLKAGLRGYARFMNEEEQAWWKLFIERVERGNRLVVLRSCNCHYSTVIFI